MTMLMPLQFRVVLLVLSSIAFAGVGVAAAMQRYRLMEFGVSDRGLSAVASLLCVFAGLCAALASGATTAIALLLPIVPASYAFTAQRVGLFRIVTGAVRVRVAEETELHT